MRIRTPPIINISNPNPKSMKYVYISKTQIGSITHNHTVGANYRGSQNQEECREVRSMKRSRNREMK